MNKQSKTQRRWLLALFLILPIMGTVMAQSSRVEVISKSHEKLIFHFQIASSDINQNYMGNRPTFQKMNAVLIPENIANIDSIVIHGYASPEGSSIRNIQYAEDRAQEFKTYLNKSHPYIPHYKIQAQGMGVNWKGLRNEVQADLMTPERNKILWVIDHIPAEIDLVRNTSRRKSLMDLNQTTGSWKYLKQNHFPRIRNVIVEIYGSLSGLSSVVSNGKDYKIETVSPCDTVYIVKRDTIYIERNAEKYTPTYEYVSKPLFALKTNLLFDLASLVNIELEVPIGNRWSIAAEWIFPWWTFDNGQFDSPRHRLQLMSGTLEARYWFGNRANRPVMTGWFGGIHAGAGLYDFEYNKEGYQGNFILGGISAGYAHPISKHLRMEYSLGLGYMETDYKFYNARWSNVDNRYHAIVQHQERRSYFGPTRAKVSLVWMLNYKARKEVRK